MAPTETKGSDLGYSAILGLEWLQWKQWGRLHGDNGEAFTPVHFESPTPSFPMEPVSRTDRLGIVLAMHH